MFDINVLVTDGYSVTLFNDDPWISDQSETELWYNRTWFEGDAQDPAKRDQFPLLELINYIGSTNVDSMSTGYRRGLSWGEGSNYRLTIGHDLRFVKQELNELSTGIPFGGFFPILDANSPIPKSFSVNPGIFSEYSETFCCDWTFRKGGRLDDVQTDIVENPENLQSITFSEDPIDYITFENMNTLRFGPTNEVQQVSLKYVNTRLATLVGFDAYAEFLPRQRLSPFAQMRYVDGRDRTRNGDFATRQGEAGSPSVRVTGLPRGAFSFVPGSDSEPLPGIVPLETRIGVRLRDDAARPQWNVELAARVVDNQDRVATSLLESTTPGFTVWDLRGMYQPTSVDGLTIAAGIENLTDKAYREHLDFRSFTGVSVLQPGSNFYAGIDWVY